MDFTQVNDGRRVLGTFNTLRAGRPCSHRESDALSVSAPFQAFWRETDCQQTESQRDSVLASYTGICHHAVTAHGQPFCAVKLCLSCISHECKRCVPLWRQNKSGNLTSCTEGQARVKNNDLQTDSYRDNVLTQDVSTLASAALGRMSWLTLYFQQESSGADPHRHSRITAAGGEGGVITFLSTALPKAAAGVWNRRALCSHPAWQRRTCHLPRQCHSWQPADT